MISPEALEKARSLVANYGSDPDGLLVGAIAAAIQSLVARNAELEAGIADIADAADSFRDESGDEVAGQIRIRTARLLNKDRQP